MQYLDCPRCRARFHTGAIYERLEVCPRCGAPMHLPRPTIGERLRQVLKRPAVGEVPDWEEITGSQYAGRSLVRPEDRGPNSNTPTRT